MAKLQELPLNPRLVSGIKPLPLNPHRVSGIKLKNDPIEFDGDCVDPYAKFVIAEALDFAIETSVSRLKRAGQVLTDVETRGYSALEIVQGIRDALEKAPSCPRELTIAEQNTLTTYLAREGIKKRPGPAPSKVVKPRAEKLTGEVWNTMPVAEREELVQKARLEGKRGAAAFGSFTKEEAANLEKAYAAPLKGKPAAVVTKKPPKKKAEAEPKEVLMIQLIPITLRDEKDPKIKKQVAWGVAGAEGEQIERISVEEGTRLIGEGKARLF